jgi:hypothetical protein
VKIIEICTGEEVLLLVTHGLSLACDGRVACPSRFSFAVFSYLARTVRGWLIAQ